MTEYHGDVDDLLKRLLKDCILRPDRREVADCIEAQRDELINTKRIVSAAKWFTTYIQVDATMSGPVVTGVARGAKDEHGVGVNRAWSVLCAAFTTYSEAITPDDVASPKETGECQGHEDGYYHSCTATDNGRTVCDRCGLLRPRRPPPSEPAGECPVTREPCLGGKLCDLMYCAKDDELRRKPIRAPSDSETSK